MLQFLSISLLLIDTFIQPRCTFRIPINLCLFPFWSKFLIKVSMFKTPKFFKRDPFPLFWYCLSTHIILITWPILADIFKIGKTRLSQPWRSCKTGGKFEYRSCCILEVVEDDHLNPETMETSAQISKLIYNYFAIHFMNFVSQEPQL